MKKTTMILNDIDKVLEQQQQQKNKKLQSASANVGAEIGRGLGHAAGASAKAVGQGAKFLHSKYKERKNEL